MTTPLRKYGESALTQPIGIGSSEARQAEDRAFNNEELVKKKQAALGRRAYRNAMRSNNPATQFQAMEALGNAGLGFKAGISQSGQSARAERSRFDATRGQLAAFNGQHQGQPQAGAPVWDGDNNGVPNSIHRPGMSPSTPGLDRGSSTPGLDSNPARPAPGPLQQRITEASGAFVTPRQQFARDLSSSKLIEDADPAAIQRAYDRGATLDLSREQINKFAGLPGEPAPVAATQQQPTRESLFTANDKALASDLGDASRLLKDAMLGNHLPAPAAPAAAAATPQGPGPSRFGDIEKKLGVTLHSNDRMYRIQQGLTTGHFSKQIGQLENDVRVTDQGPLMSAITRAFSPDSLRVLTNAPIVNYDDPTNYVSPIPVDEQKTNDDRLDARIATLQKKRPGKIANSSRGHMPANF